MARGGKAAAHDAGRREVRGSRSVKLALAFEQAKDTAARRVLLDSVILSAIGA